MFGNPEVANHAHARRARRQNENDEPRASSHERSRDGHSIPGMEPGAVETFDRLEELLAGRPTTAIAPAMPMEARTRNRPRLRCPPRTRLRGMDRSGAHDAMVGSGRFHQPQLRTRCPPRRRMANRHAFAGWHRFQVRRHLSRSRETRAPGLHQRRRTIRHGKHSVKGFTTVVFAEDPGNKTKLTL